jgi:hypothetical protein
MPAFLLPGGLDAGRAVFMLVAPPVLCPTLSCGLFPSFSPMDFTGKGVMIFLVRLTVRLFYWIHP